MMRKKNLLPLLFVFCLLTYSSADTTAEKLKKKIQSVVDKTQDAFIFIGGGSGVIISPDGYALTNFHVVGFVKSTYVTLNGEKSYYADIVGRDPYGDIALLKLRNAKNLKYIELGDSDKMEAGDYAIALGNPFMLGSKNNHPVVTFGIISSLHRTKWMMDGWERISGAYLDIIQSDVSVNPGNSGGPLINMNGELIGINGMIEPRFGNRVNSGTAYAISVKVIKNFLEKLKENGIVYHGTIKGLKVRFQNENGTGAIVSAIAENSPASKIGLKTNDLILSVNNVKIYNGVDFLSTIESYPAGTEVKIKWLSDENEYEKNVTLQKKKMNSIPFIQQFIQTGQMKPAYVGIKVDNDENDDYEDFIKVRSVAPNSPADEAGIEVGDIITHIDGCEVICKALYYAMLYYRKPKQKLQLKIVREGEPMDFEITLRDK